MRRSWAEASRIAEVRHAARSWHEAERIDAATLGAIQTAYPDPRPTLSPAWKALIFVLVSVAIQGVFFGVLQLMNAEWPLSWVLAGAILAASTEALRNSRFAGNGSDAATSFWAIVYVLVGLGFFLFRGPNRDLELAVTVLLLLACLGFAAGCAHWGYATYGVFAAAALFGLLGRFPSGRILWMVVAGIVMAVSAARLDRGALAPPHRRSFAGAFAVAALALYAAVNLYSVDHRLIEALRAVTVEGAPVPAIRFLSAVATAVVPIALFVWGVRTRRMLILDLGVLFAASSLVTLRFYVHLAPLWVVLVAAGAALSLGALWLNRRLRRAPNGERGGFTAVALSSGAKAGNMTVAAVVVGLAPGAPPGAAVDRDGFSGGGGRFGGGGATGSF